MSIDDELYKELIIEHTKSPSKNIPLVNPSIKESGVNRSCGDEIELELLVEGDTIKDVAALNKGCSISTASASMMAEAIIGMKVKDALLLVSQFKSMVMEEGMDDPHFPESARDLVALKGVQKYPIRVKCATLPWNTLEQALKSIQ